MTDKQPDSRLEKEILSDAEQNTVAKRLIPNEVLLPEVARLVAQGRHVTIVVKGNSMNPFMVDGRDRVVLSPFSEAELLPGAVVLAQDTEGRYVLHRIVSRKGNNLLLQGDGNLAQTETTTVSQVMAVVSKVQRKGVTYSVTGRVWRCYSWWWRLLRPARRWLLALFRRL